MLLQVIRCADAGAEMVRITVQGMQEAKACKEIKRILVEKGYNTPLIADIHFAPKARGENTPIQTSPRRHDARLL